MNFVLCKSLSVWLEILVCFNPTGYAQVLEEKKVSGGTTNLARLYMYWFSVNVSFGVEA